LDARLSLLKEKARPYLLKGRPDDWEHTLRALEYGKTLNQEEGGDPEIILTALVLHDIGWSRVALNDFLEAPMFEKKDTDSALKHMEQSALLAREILQELEFPKEKMGPVLTIIADHDRLDRLWEMRQLEATLVFEADRLDRFGPESLRRYEKMFGRGFLQEGRRYLLKGAEIWFQTPTGKRLARELIDQMPIDR
jgi:HD superfamily phosphodiesterase